MSSALHLLEMRNVYTYFVGKNSTIKRLLKRYGLIILKYIFFWVFPRRLSFKRRRFGTLYRFHLLRQVK